MISSCKIEILYPLNTKSPLPFFSASGNHHMIDFFFLKRADGHICICYVILSVSHVFHDKSKTKRESLVYKKGIL